MRIIALDLTPDAAPKGGRPRNTRPRSKRTCEYDQLWSPNETERRPRGFPVFGSAEYRPAAEAYIHISTQALLDAQTATANPVPFIPKSEYEKAQAEINRGRTLISPDVLSDADLKRYVERLAPLALGSSAASRIAPQSPLIAPYLVGGMPNQAFEELCERVLAVCEFPEELVDPSFNDALTCVGFGEHAVHDHQDAVRASDVNREIHEDELTHALRLRQSPEVPGAQKGYLSARQQWLMDKIPEGPFCNRLMRIGAYDESLIRKVSRMKWEVCRQTALQFWGEPMSADSEMTGLAREQLEGGDPFRYQQATWISDQSFSSAVARVFERPWLELDLSGQRADLMDDVERVMARLIIKKLAGGGNRSLKNTVKLSARTIVAMSLLTGVPLGNWIRFALLDFARRGETFIDRGTIDAIFDLVYSSELMVYFTAAEELEEYKFKLGAWDLEEQAPAISRFAHKLRAGVHVLWSTGMNRYHLVTEAKSLRETNRWKPYADVRLAGCPRKSPYQV